MTVAWTGGHTAWVASNDLEQDGVSQACVAFIRLTGTSTFLTVQNACQCAIRYPARSKSDNRRAGGTTTSGGELRLVGIVEISVVL